MAWRRGDDAGNIWGFGIEGKREPTFRNVVKSRAQGAQELGAKREKRFRECQREVSQPKNRKRVARSVGMRMHMHQNLLGNQVFIIKS